MLIPLLQGCREDDVEAMESRKSSSKVSFCSSLAKPGSELGASSMGLEHGVPNAGDRGCRSNQYPPRVVTATQWRRAAPGALGHALKLGALIYSLNCYLMSTFYVPTTMVAQGMHWRVRQIMTSLMGFTG